MTDSISKSTPKPMAVPVAVGLWMAIQVMVIGFTDSVRLWPHHPAPPQSASMVELIVVQLAAVALFCRAIDRWGTAFLMASSAVFFGQIAALQASVSPVGVFRAEIIVALWIAGARLTQTSRSATLSRFAPAILSIWVFLPPLFALGKYDQPSIAVGPNFFELGVIDRALRQIDGVHLTDLSATMAPGVTLLTLAFFNNYVLPKLRKSPAQPV